MPILARELLTLEVLETRVDVCWAVATRKSTSPNISFQVHSEGIENSSNFKTLEQTETQMRGTFASEKDHLQGSQFLSFCLPRRIEVPDWALKVGFCAVNTMGPVMVTSNNSAQKKGRLDERLEAGRSKKVH